MGKPKQPAPKTPKSKVTSPKTSAGKKTPAGRAKAAATPAPKRVRVPRDPATQTYWHNAFLKKYAETGIQTDAMRELGIPIVLLRRHRKKYPAFDALVKEMYEVVLDCAEDEGWRRSWKGYDEPVIYKGQLCYQAPQVDADGNEINPNAELIPLTVRKFSDSLLQFMLQSGRPEKFRSNVKVQVDDLDSAIQRALEGLAALEKDLVT